MMEQSGEPLAVQRLEPRRRHLLHLEELAIVPAQAGSDRVVRGEECVLAPVHFCRAARWRGDFRPAIGAGQSSEPSALKPGARWIAFIEGKRARLLVSRVL